MSAKTTYEARIIRVHDSKTVATSWRKRIDHARLAARKLAYEYLGYDGMLDRPCAHKAMDWLAEWNTCDPKGEHALGPSYRIKLRVQS